MTESMHVRVDFILGVRNASRPLTRATALSNSVGASGVVGGFKVGVEATNCSRSGSDAGEASSGSDRLDSHSGGEYRERGKNMSRDARGLEGSSVLDSAGVSGMPGVPRVAGVAEVRGETTASREDCCLDMASRSSTRRERGVEDIAEPEAIGGLDVCMGWWMAENGGGDSGDSGGDVAKYGCGLAHLCNHHPSRTFTSRRESRMMKELSVVASSSAIQFHTSSRMTLVELISILAYAHFKNVPGTLVKHQNSDFPKIQLTYRGLTLLGSGKYCTLAFSFSLNYRPEVEKKVIREVILASSEGKLVSCL